MSLKLPLAPAAYDQGDQAQARGAIERADQQNRKRQEDLVLAPSQRLVFFDEHGTEQHFTGPILGALVRSDTAAQGLTPAEQANARANIDAGRAGGTPGGSSGQVQFNSGGGFGGFTLGGDGTLDVLTGALTLATVNPDAGTFGDGAHVGQVTVNAKGLVTAAASVGIAFPVTAFNGRTGAISLASADVTGALGYTPGAVSSVGLSAPAMFTVTGSPVTTSGTLALALAGQGANMVLAGPASGAAAGPTFRALAGADLPNNGANPAATASDAAVNGAATTWMRSDAAPAVQKGSSSQFGIVKVDGTTITASGGVISAVGGGVSLIASVNPSGTGTVSFTSIPGTYKHLKIIGVGRSTKAGTGTDEVGMQFNSDNGTNYYWQSVFGTASTVGAGPGTTSYIRIGELETAGDAANQAASFESTIPNYAGSTFYKRSLYHYGVNNTATVNNLVAQIGTGTWKNTAAITRIDLVLTGGGNWVSGSEVSLYGYN